MRARLLLLMIGLLVPLAGYATGFPSSPERSRAGLELVLPDPPEGLNRVFNAIADDPLDSLANFDPPRFFRDKPSRDQWRERLEFFRSFHRDDESQPIPDVPVPEPSTALMLVLGLLGLATRRR